MSLISLCLCLVGGSLLALQVFLMAPGSKVKKMGFSKFVIGVFLVSLSVLYLFVINDRAYAAYLFSTGEAGETKGQVAFVEKDKFGVRTVDSICRIVFVYRVSGNSYSSDMFSPRGGRDYAKCVIDYSPGDYIDIFYSKNDPSVAVIEIDNGNVFYLLGLFLAMLFLGGGLVVTSFFGGGEKNHDNKQAH